MSLKKNCIQVLLTDFAKYHATLGKLTLNALEAKCKDILLPDSSEHSLLSFISAFFECRYGSVISAALLDLAHIEQAVTEHCRYIMQVGRK